MDTTPLAPAFHQLKQPKNGRKIRKPRKEKENPIKVVYISNPIKVSATASEFRALVQRLTGQDAADLPDPSKFDALGADQTDLGSDNIVGADAVPAGADEESQREVDAASFDEVFTPQMLESLLAPTTTGFCSLESAHFDILRSLDAV